ncbi:hypothetical protein [Clostridium haemolyticum]|uniref:hypothetical protein n=1 Tax=Clostridium haemolyticum TaxID=84025 RepID=UPI001FA8EB07|nr:hypothetical protein [Clostridium haemolyticum]
MYKNLFINMPKNNSIIHDKFPKITLISLNTIYFTHCTNIKMYLNNKKVHYKIIDNKITYVPNKKLHSGIQKVRVVIYDYHKEKKRI